MKKLVYILFTCIAISCTNAADNATLTKSGEKQISSPAYAQVIMTMSPSDAKMYFGSSLPSFEAVIATETYYSDGFVLKDGHYEASICFPCSKRTLQTITFNLIDEDTSSITLHCVPLNPEKPTVLDFELFLCNVDFNVSINPSFESEMQS